MKRATRLFAFAFIAALTGAVFLAVNRRSPLGDTASLAVRLPLRSTAFSSPKQVQSVASESSALETQWGRLLGSPANSAQIAAFAKILLELHPAALEKARRLLLSLEPTDRIAVASATLRLAAVRSSELAVRQAIALCDDDPAYALEYGRALISALESTGDHSAALSFVLAEDAVDGWLGENAHKWITAIFTSWAKSAPAEATRAARETVGANYRDEALQIIAAVSAAN